MRIPHCLQLAKNLGFHLQKPVHSRQIIVQRLYARVQTNERAVMGLEDRILTAQAFSSNLLNRSTLDRRDAAFLSQSLPDAQILLVSGGWKSSMSSSEPPLLATTMHTQPTEQDHCRTGNKISVVISDQEVHHLSWHTLDDLKKAGFHEHAGGLTYSTRPHCNRPHSTFSNDVPYMALTLCPLFLKSAAGSAGHGALAVVPFLLGQEGKQWMLAADVSSLHTHLTGNSSHPYPTDSPGR